VCGMRLAGHATDPEHMIRSRKEDWLATIEDGYHLIHSSCEKIFFLGLSMGGILSLTTGSKLPVAGIVAMSTPFMLPPDPRLKYLKLISVFIPYLEKGSEEPGSGWFDKEVWKQHVAYPQNPLRSIAELSELMNLMRLSLPEIKVPVLLIHSRDDDYVIKGSMDSIYDALGSTDKQKLWVEGGGHVITEEPTRHVVFEAAAQFIERVSRA
jgi:carboxylesterase